MFQQTFVPEVRSGRRPVSVAVSVMLQAAVLALLALGPLFVSRPLPTAQLRSFLLGPAPPVPLEKTVAHSGATSQTTMPRAHSFRLTAPVVIPARINQPAGTLAPAPDVAFGNSAANAESDSLLSALGGHPGDAAPPPPKEHPKPEEHSAPLAVGGNVAAANLIQRVEPIYPPLAKTARVQGTVTFQAVIGVDGRIRNLQLQSGHPLLVAAARSAILEWRYRPTLLNGKPVEVLTTITVRFALSQ